jgi:hypothetical protein
MWECSCPDEGFSGEEKKDETTESLKERMRK